MSENRPCCRTDGNGYAARLYRYALLLGGVTLGYNIIEGLVSVWFGFRDETLALFGFGLDSFVEVISAAGIIQMVLRIRAHPDSETSTFERRALRITGGSFYLLAAGLAATAVLNIAQGRRPETTFWGMVVSAVSLAAMGLLLKAKLAVGRKLRSEPIIADAGCTKMCLYMSAVLLASSVLYALTGIGWLDSAGALGIAWLSVREGGESFEKAEGKRCGGGCCCGK